MARSMLDRYGGFAFLSRVVMDFYDRAIESDTLGPFFEDVDMRRLVDHQTKFVAFLMGGPASYSDDALHQIHAHLEIDDAAFDAMVATFIETIEDHAMDAADVDQLAEALRLRRGVVVRGAG